MNRILDFKVVIASPCYFCSRNTIHKPIKSLEIEGKKEKINKCPTEASFCPVLLQSIISPCMDLLVHKMSENSEKWP